MELDEAFKKALEKEQNAYINDFLSHAPKDGPFTHMPIRNLANAVMSWIMYVADGGGPGSYASQIEIDVSDLTTEAFAEMILGECQDRRIAAPEPTIRNVAKDAWDMWMEPGKPFATLADEQKAYLDRYMLVFMPKLAFPGISMLTQCELAVLSWINALINNQSQVLTRLECPWNEDYDVHRFQQDVYALAKRYRLPDGDADIKENTTVFWPRIDAAIRKGPTMASTCRTQKPRSAQFQDTDIEQFTDGVIAAYGYTGNRAKDTAYYLPKLISGEMSPEEFVKHWREHGTCKGG